MMVAAMFGEWSRNQEFNGEPPSQRIDAEMVLPNPSIPEYGQLGGVLAGGVGFGIMMTVRRRFANN